MFSPSSHTNNLYYTLNSEMRIRQIAVIYLPAVI